MKVLWVGIALGRNLLIANTFLFIFFSFRHASKTS